MTFSTASLSNYEEFYAEWYPRAVKAAAKRGLPDPEAVASDIMIVFFEKDYLEKYDPTAKGAVAFSSWVESILYGRLNNVHRDLQRKPQAHDSIEIGDVDGAPEDDYFDVADFKLLAVSAFELINERYGEDVSRVWVSVVKQVVDGTVGRSGRALQAVVMQHLSMSQWKATVSMNRLREVLVEDPDLREMFGAHHWAREAA